MGEFHETAVGFDACDGGSVDTPDFGRYESSSNGLSIECLVLMMLLIAHDILLH